MTVKTKVFAAACVLFLLSFAVQYSPDTFGRGTPTKCVIVEESSMRSSLLPEQRNTIMKAASLGVLVVDQDIVGPDKKTQPTDLVPFLKAAKEKPLPQLTRKWSNNRVTSVAMPYPFEKLKEAVQ